MHSYEVGLSNYWVWTNHGEESPVVSSTSIRVENNVAPSSSIDMLGVDYYISKKECFIYKLCQDCRECLY